MIIALDISKLVYSFNRVLFDKLFLYISFLYNSKMSLSNRFDYSFKFILVGDTGVGKTSVINRFVENRFDNNHSFTVGVEFASKNIVINGKVIKMQIWDTAGQEEFKSITRSYYRSSAAALVVFDITRK